MYGIGYWMFGPEFYILLPAIIFALYAQTKVQSTFNQYLKVWNSSGYTGAQVARMILDKNGLYDVSVEMIGGRLTDHYDPRRKVIRLSREVYGGSSIASLGVAAHESGHAIQHATGYFPLILRDNIAPVASFSSRFVWILVILGLLISPELLRLGIILYLAIVIFQIVTLPVEFNASRRAIYQLGDGIITENEIEPVKKVLNAAAMTYVAATLVALGQLLRLMILNNRRR